jgi:hypothetical protein
MLLVALVLAITANVAETRAAQPRPSDGFTLHIDAKMHFPGKPEMIAHHWCKPVAGGLVQCQLFDSDNADARLVGVEVVVPAATFRSFTATEKAMWHYHKTEIPKVSATLPDLSPEEARKVAKSLEETYGKIYLLWDPSRSSLPLGRPSVTILK